MSLRLQMKALTLAIKGALDNYEQPDSPEGLDAAMRWLRTECEMAEIELEWYVRRTARTARTRAEDYHDGYVDGLGEVIERVSALRSAKGVQASERA